MKVIVISEKDHGVIGCVETKDDVLPWLIRKDWINGYFEEYYNYETYEFTFLIDKYGPNWYQHLKAMSWDELKLYLAGAFDFYEMEVWSAS